MRTSLVTIMSMGLCLAASACSDDTSTRQGAAGSTGSGSGGSSGSAGSVSGGSAGTGGDGPGGAGGSPAAGGSAGSGGAAGSSSAAGAGGSAGAAGSAGTGASGGSSSVDGGVGASGGASGGGGTDGSAGPDGAAGEDAGTGGNQNPAPLDDAVDAVQGVLATFDVLTNDSDPDGDSLTVVSVQGALQGTTAINGQRVDYTPSAVFAGQDTFTYTVIDGNGGQATATVTVTVDAVPNAVNDQAVTTLDQPVVIDVLENDSDPDGDSLTVVDVEIPSNGTVLTNGTTITFTPDSGFLGSETFSYTINDGRGGTDTATIALVVTRAPTPLGDTAQTPMGVPVEIDVLANDTDPDGDSLVLGSVAQGTGGTVFIQSGRVHFTPDNGFFGSAIFTYTVEDQHGAATTATVSVDVSPYPEGLVASSGTWHTCAISSDDSLNCWGYNVSGQLGINSNVAQATPQAVGAGMDWLLVDGGDRQTCGIRGAGTLWCWGSGSDGQLGLGRSQSSSVPAQVGSDLWADVSTGDRHTCAIKMDQSLWCVAWNSDGQVGVGDNSLWVDNLTEVTVGSRDWFRVSAGDYHTCGIKSGGELWCWGSNSNEQLGDPSISSDRDTPARIGVADDWSDVHAAQRHTCGLRGGALYCWGSGAGTGTGGTGSVDTPTLVTADTDWSSVSVGADHSCGVRSGELYCWGSNIYGQLGDGTLLDALSPIRIGTDTDWVGVTAAAESTCAWKADDSFYCWGRKLHGGLGDGDLPIALSPVQVGADTDWHRTTNSADVFGRGFTCGVKADDSLFCWGFNANGQLGTGDTAPRQLPTQVGVATSWDSFGVGLDHSCALQTDQSRWCWGSNWLGMFGSGDRTGSNVPVQVDLSSWLSTDGGRHHGCGVMANGTMWCWGRNNNGQIGADTATVSESNSPLQIGTDTDWTMTSTGEWRSCALKSGQLWCWGATYGDAPVQVGTDADWASFEHGASQLCGVKTNDTLWCGDIGSTPTQIGTDTDWAQVATNNAGHACARRTSNTLWCWGANNVGQLGDGTTTQRSLPTQVGTDSDWSHVSVGEDATCAVKSTGQLWCWGSNDSGQLGIGGAWIATPQLISL